MTWISHWLCVRKRERNYELSVWHFTSINRPARMTEVTYLREVCIWRIDAIENVIHYLGLFFFLIVIVILRRVVGNVLQLTSTLLISVKGRNEPCWRNVLSVSAVYFKDIQSLRYCIQLHIIVYKRKAFFFFFTF